MFAWLTRLANTLMRYYLATPAPLRWLFWLLPLIYFVMPFDLDRLGLLGRLDDILVVYFVFWALSRAGKFRGFFAEARARGRNRTGQPPPTDDLPDDEDPYAVLGVPPGTGPAELKKAYRRLVGLYHPDKFAHLGPEFEATAQRRTRAVIAAYQRLCP